jgi:antirestriction protein ArdC
VGAAMGDGSDQGAARHAAQRFHPARISGINVLILWGAVIEHGFSGQSWLTFRQVLGLGGHVRKGERGTTVVYADRFTPDDERRRAAEAGEEPGAIPFLKRFTVGNEKLSDDILDAGRMTAGGRTHKPQRRTAKAMRSRLR